MSKILTVGSECVVVEGPDTAHPLLAPLTGAINCKGCNNMSAVELDDFGLLPGTGLESGGYDIADLSSGITDDPKVSRWCVYESGSEAVSDPVS